MTLRNRLQRLTQASGSRLGRCLRHMSDEALRQIVNIHGRTRWPENPNGPDLSVLTDAELERIVDGAPIPARAYHRLGKVANDGAA